MSGTRKWKSAVFGSLQIASIGKNNFKKQMVKKLNSVVLRVFWNAERFCQSKIKKCTQKIFSVVKYYSFLP
jgi:hypothetical protein